ncbi:hypothetical protein M9H77_31227 [Catharanthus roseus]|uniref:Uncharacterized protein n=1 Tax=Catharanthus roseus TaxID=4058 RepID=A0ACB9ZZG4_CATRO|nr:hypothetical protein M9H77_31227 [Catharanthus roseus]
MYQEVSVTRNLNSARSKPVWQDVKESMRTLQLQLNSVEKNIGNMERRLDQREREYAKVGYYGNLGYQEYDEEDSYYQIGQSCWKKNEIMGRILEWVMRATKVLGIPTWMMDMGIGIHMNKKLGTMERKPLNLKRA